MLVKDLLGKDIDIDCYADDESFGIAFCGPLELTQEGYNKFEAALWLEMEVSDDCSEAVIIIPDEKHSKIAKEFFRAAAGYCSCSDYDKWFIMCGYEGEEIV